MLKKVIVSILSLVAINAFAAPAADPNTAIVNKAITAFMKENNVTGVAVEMYIDGKPHSYYYGYANPVKKQSVDKDTIFELGSISKVMAGILLAQEVDINNLQLTDPVTKYLKDLPSSFSTVTLQSLATHTAGLPYELPGNIKTQADLQAYFTAHSFDYTPNNQWKYSNVDIGILGATLATTTTKEYDQLYRRHISLPLGMRTIGFSVPKKFEKNFAQGFDENNKPVKATDQQNLFIASWGIKASANDMQRFLSAAIGLPGTPPRVFYPMRMAQTSYVRIGNTYQGLGWQVHTLTDDTIPDLLSEPESMNLGPMTAQQVGERPTFDGNALIDKSGVTNGFSSYIALIPNKKTGIVILANHQVKHGEIVNVGRDILFEVNHLGAEESAEG